MREFSRRHGGHVSIRDGSGWGESRHSIKIMPISLRGMIAASYCWYKRIFSSILRALFHIIYWLYDEVKPCWRIGSYSCLSSLLPSIIFLITPEVNIPKTNDIIMLCHYRRWGHLLNGANTALLSVFVAVCHKPVESALVIRYGMKQAAARRYHDCGCSIIATYILLKWRDDTGQF